MNKLLKTAITLTAIGVAVKVVKENKNLVHAKESAKTLNDKKHSPSYDQLGNLL